MLHITIPARELWDERKGEFIYTKPQSLQLEHSLVAIKKWESKWRKPFLLKTENKTDEEMLDYVRCMTITQNVNPDAYLYLTNENIEEIKAYIEAPMTATFFSDNNTSKGNRKVVTAELIYYWMIALNIPFEYQKWHINSLLTLIRVCNAENDKPKKRNPKDMAALNAARRKQLQSRG